MWICQQCKIEIGDGFDRCWSCGTGRDGTPSINPEEFQNIKKGFDVVLVVLSGLEKEDFQAIKENIDGLLKKLKILNDLRKSGIPCDTDYLNKSLKGALRCANDVHAKYVLILGEDELKKNMITFKDMSTGEQKELRLENLIQELKC